jgi:hypothetical protein
MATRRRAGTDAAPLREARFAISGVRKYPGDSNSQQTGDMNLHLKAPHSTRAPEFAEITAEMTFGFPTPGTNENESTPADGPVQGIGLSFAGRGKN